MFAGGANQGAEGADAAHEAVDHGPTVHSILGELTQLQSDLAAKLAALEIAEDLERVGVCENWQEPREGVLEESEKGGEEGEEGKAEGQAGEPMARVNPCLVETPRLRKAVRWQTLHGSDTVVGESWADSCPLEVSDDFPKVPDFVETVFGDSGAASGSGGLEVDLELTSPGDGVGAAKPASRLDGPVEQLLELGYDECGALRRAEASLHSALVDRVGTRDADRFLREFLSTASPMPAVLRPGLFEAIARDLVAMKGSNGSN